MLKNLKTVWGRSLMYSFHCNTELLLALAPIKYIQTDTKNFQSNLTLLDFLILLQNILHKIVG